MRAARKRQARSANHGVWRAADFAPTMPRRACRSCGRKSPGHGRRGFGKEPRGLLAVKITPAGMAGGNASRHGSRPANEGSVCDRPRRQF